tara:strand:- start:22 stop:375 length:354 start_codon:yes stop_codon:yes gene_type:complete
MDIDFELETQHLFLIDRVCRVCGKEKNLIADFYKCRPDATKISSYAYECKECTRDRVREYENKIKKKYYMGACLICKETNTKVSNNVCSNCEKGLKGFKHNVDTLKNAMLYLDENTK